MTPTRILSALVLVALLASPALAGNAVNNPPSTGGGGGAVSSVSAAGGGCVTISPTTGAVIVDSSGCAGGGVTSAVAGTGIAISGATGAVTFSLASVADQRIVGNVSGGSAAPIALTQAQIVTFLGSSFLIPGNNLSDVGSAATSRTNLGVPSGSGTSTGTNTGDQTITLTGAVTGSGTGSFATTFGGKSGGQTVIGDTLTTGNLTLRSNSADLTTGKTIFGTTSLMYFDTSTTQLAIGNSAPPTGYLLALNKNVNSTASAIYISNPNTAGSAASALQLGQSATNPFGAALMGFYCLGSGYTAAGTYIAGSGLLELFGGTGNMDFSIIQASGDFAFTTTSSHTERLRITNAGVLKFGSASIVANGSQILTVGATGPAGIASTTPFEYMTGQDSTGNTIWWPVYH